MGKPTKRTKKEAFRVEMPSFVRFDTGSVYTIT